MTLTLLLVWAAIVAGLGLIALLAYNVTKELHHRVLVYRAYREYRRFNDELAQARRTQALRGLAEMGKR